MSQDAANVGSFSAHNANSFQARVWFLKGGVVRLRVSHPPNATSAERAAYNALQPKCLGQVLCNKPPKYFDIKVLGTPSVPVVEVLIQSKLVQLIPLLQDVAGNTATDGDGYSDLEVVEEREARLALPCSVWGLVSLLLLEEGNVDIEHWFEGPYTHPALHMQTLEAADFMRCEDARTAIIAWMQTALCKTMTVYTMGPMMAASAAQRESPRIWYITRVLRHVTQQFSAEVFSIVDAMSRLDRAKPDSLYSTDPDIHGSAAHLAWASHLPQELFSQVLSQLAPTLELGTAGLSHSQLMRVAMTLQELDPATFQTIDLSIPFFREEAVSTTAELQGHFRQLLKHADDLKSEFDTKGKNRKLCRCCNIQCNSGMAGKATHVTVGFACPSMQCSHRYFTATKGAPKLSIAAMRKSQTVNESLVHLQDHCQQHTKPIASQCCASAHVHSRCPSIASLGFLCAVCGEFCAIVGAPMLELPQPSLSRSGFDLLSMFGAVLSGMTVLTRFRLRLPPLETYPISMIGQLLNSLPATVTSLTLTSTVAKKIVGELGSYDEASSVSVSDKVLLFRGIALVTGVKELYIPQWDTLVGRHGLECTRPLMEMPELECVYVGESLKRGSRSELSMFPPIGINFQDSEVPEAQEAADGEESPLYPSEPSNF